MITLTNGAHVMRATLNFEDPDCAVGYVLARWGTDFVTWAVYRHAGRDAFDAEVGHYFHFDPNDSASIAKAEREAKTDFNGRTAGRFAA